MDSTLLMKPVAKPVSGSFLKVNRSKGQIQSTFQVYKIEDHGSIIAYCPQFNLSGYGTNYKEAMNMLRAGLDDYFRELLGLKQEMINGELRKYGWEKTPFSSRKFNGPSVGKDGVLRNFDLPEDTPIEGGFVQVA